MNDEEVKYPNDKDNEFYFESDHIALRDNKDYSAFLKTIVVLEAQRIQAIKDLDKLMSIRSKAMKDPIAFVAELQAGNHHELPGAQKIPEIPCIDWSQYNITVPDARMRPQTRHGNVLPQTHTKSEEEDGKILVRGRAFDQSKPETFNQLWTYDEQRRLEELLVEYPPEEIEMRRWTKIAKALGNRTPKQVSSRVQKYFIKLGRAGLPIPGRGPKVKVDFKKGLTPKQRNNNFLMRRSTFFPHQNISFGTSNENKEQLIAEESEEDTKSGGMDDNFDFKQTELLSHQVRTEKDQDSSTYNDIEYRCTICDAPIKDTGWYCKDCPDRCNFCNYCAILQSGGGSPKHNPYHTLIRTKTQYTRNYDLDYLPQSFSNSDNYLDPNFMPE